MLNVEWVLLVDLEKLDFISEDWNRFRFDLWVSPAWATMPYYLAFVLFCKIYMLIYFVLQKIWLSEKVRL